MTEWICKSGELTNCDFFLTMGTNADFIQYAESYTIKQPGFLNC